MALTRTTLRVTSGIAAIVLAASGCGGTSCQEIVNQYFTDVQIADAAGCDPNSSVRCSVELPIEYVLVDSTGQHPEGLASNCNAGYDPDQSTNLQALYQQFQTLGCKTAPIPVCGNTTNTSQCVQADASMPTKTGYICNN
jgi:hypothetical protein